MNATAGKGFVRGVATHLICFGCIAVPLAAIFLVAPTEQTMGDAQRILYVHVAVAWGGLAMFLIMAGSGLGYLLRRDLAWDHWAEAAAELGWLCTMLTLITGSLWAHAAWNTWWTWDPRLMTTFVLWAISCGYLIVRGGLDEPRRRARISAVLAILGVADIPLIIMATRWFRTIHPAAAAMESPMRVVLLVSIVGFSGLLAVLLVQRQAQLALQSQLGALQQCTED